MDSFSNFKGSHKKHPRAHKNTDGFIRPADKDSGVTGGGIQFERRSEDEGLSRIDNFNRAEGYHPASQPTVGLSTVSKSPTLPHGPRNRSKFADTPRKKRKWWMPHRPKSWKKFFKRSAIVIAALIFFIGGFIGWRLYRTQKQVLNGGGNAPAVCDGNVPIEKLNSEGDARVNILLVGIGGPGHDGPDLTDTLIIASVDTVTDKIDLISIPRDLWVQYSDGYSSGKINAVYAYAKQASKSKTQNGKVKDGLAQLDKTITTITGVKIHYNSLVSFKAFKDAVNAVGGVSVNVPEQLYDPTVAWENNWNPIIAQKGTQKFDGAKALLYARSRETSSDFARGERQRLLLVSLKDKVLSLGTYSNPVKITKLLSTLGNNVYTDFDVGDIKCLYKQVSEIQSSNIKSLDLVTPPHDLLTTGPINGLSTVFPKAGLYQYGPMQTYIRTTFRDGFLARENAEVLVLNGTNTGGLADKYKALLKSYGYNVAKAGDAPTHNYQKTVIVNLSKVDNKYTLNYLEKRFKVKADKKLPDGAINAGTASFVIILGTDLVN